MSADPAGDAGSPRTWLTNRVTLILAVVLVVLILAAIGFGIWVAWSPAMEPIRIESRPSA